MTFPEFPYQRPDMSQIKAEFTIALQAFQQAVSLEDAVAAFDRIYQLRSEFQTMYNIAYIRHSSDTRDEFYEAENRRLREAAKEMREELASVR